jgi:WD domain, G-beta repeat/Caspase domain
VRSLPARNAPGAALSSSDTRALLIGTGTHAADSGLPNVPAVSTTLIDLKQVLVSQCGMAEGTVQLLTDPLSALDVGCVLTESAGQAKDVLLVCYVGHGLVSPGGELYLATKSTERRPDLLAYTALAYTAVRTSLLQSPARSIVVILDCCFSGKAVGVLGVSESAMDLAQVNGGYVLTSAASEELALAPPGARHTAFTGELIKLLRQGDPDGPPLLRLRDIYQYLNRVLPARGFPKPHRRANGRIDDLVFTSNPAYRPPEEASRRRGEAGPEIEKCPYPGLTVFHTEDAWRFFGRERVITELMGRLAARLEQACPLILVGASGSGKSSLLRAGLLPALADGALRVPGSRTWPHLLLTPTTDPVRELATQLARLAGTEPGAVHAELVADPDGFATTVGRILVSWAGGGEISGARMVIVVDQFEETFLRCTDDQDRQAFIQALCAAASAGDAAVGSEPPALVVLGVRADLYGRCAAYPELLPALQDGQVVLGPMRLVELRAAIEGPAHAAGLTLEPGLVETLLRELGVSNGPAGAAAGAATCDPGALPLLSHALQATWEHREDRTLTVAGYQATGGIRGGIATTAETMFQGFDSAGQQAVRRLLLRMVQIGDGVADTRLRVDRNTLIVNSPDPALASTVFDACAHTRLITADENAAEITHEALLRAWPRLRGWIDADRAGLYVHQQLTDAAQQWDRDGRPASALYRDTALAVAQDWAQEPHHHSDLGTLERDFLTASQALHTCQQQASHRRAHRVRQLITGLVVLLVLSLTGGGIALYQAHSTPAQRSPLAVLTGHTTFVTSVAFSPNGHVLASGSADHTVRLWNVAAPATSRLLSPLPDHAGQVTSVGFSPDGHVLASGSADQTVRLWNVADPTHPTSLGQPLIGHTNPVEAVAFSPDGHTLASASDNHTVRLWNVTDPTHPTPLEPTLTGHSSAVYALAFSPDGHTLASGSFDQTVRLWNVP